MPPKDQEQYVTLQEFREMKHDVYNRIQKLELNLQEGVAKLETQLILLVDIPRKLDNLIDMLNKDMIERSKESVKCANNAKEIEDIKGNMLTKKDFESEKREGKYQKWFFLLLGGMITTIIYAILGTQLPK